MTALPNDDPNLITMASDDYISFSSSPPRSLSRLLDRFSGHGIAAIREKPRLSDCHSVFDTSLASIPVHEALPEQTNIRRKRRAVRALLQGRGFSTLLWRY